MFKSGLSGSVANQLLIPRLWSSGGESSQIERSPWS